MPPHLTICCYGAFPKGDPTAGNTADLFHDVCRDIGRLIVVVPPSGPLFAVLATEVPTSASHGATLNGCCFAEFADIVRCAVAARWFAKVLSALPQQADSDRARGGSPVDGRPASIAPTLCETLGLEILAPRL